MQLLLLSWALVSVLARIEVPLVKELVDIALIAKEAKAYPRPVWQPIPAVSFNWETIEDMEAKRKEFDTFYEWFNKSVYSDDTRYGENPVMYFYTGQLDPKHISLVREKMHEFAYSKNEGRKYYISRFVKDQLYLASPEYKDHLFKQYMSDLDTAITQKTLGARYWVWPRQRMTNAYNRTKWVTYQRMRDAAFTAYTLSVACICLPITLPLSILKTCGAAACRIPEMYFT